MKILGNSSLYMSEFVTVVTEIEAVVNDRPLAKNLESAEEFERVTPSDLVNMRRLRQVPPRATTSEEVGELKTASDVMARRLHQKAVLNHF